MKSRILSTLLISFLLLAGCVAPGVQPPPSSVLEEATALDQLPTSSNGVFFLSSSEVMEGDALPKEFTCDGSSATLPLAWSGAPEGTKSFAIIMHHVPGPGDAHWYWVLYNIDSNITSLEKNSMDIGVLGNNSVNGKNVYAPPCSKGPGEKIYTYTVYALSTELKLSAPAVSRDVLLAAIKDSTLASAELNVTYTR